MRSFLSDMLILSVVSNSKLDRGADGVPFLHLQGPCHHPKLPPVLDILPPSSYRKVDDFSIYEVSSPLLKLGQRYLLWCWYGILLPFKLVPNI